MVELIQFSIQSSIKLECWSTWFKAQLRPRTHDRTTKIDALRKSTRSGISRNGTLLPRDYGDLS
uniref:Uncharacterized protein n=1 Tax=Vibrio splendidus TaxID=29497 RepID=A0A0H3ZP48_VIBSP|nr:hypothetical protein [Vibrio splendidus]